MEDLRSSVVSISGEMSPVSSIKLIRTDTDTLHRGDFCQSMIKQFTLSKELEAHHEHETGTETHQLEYADLRSARRPQGRLNKQKKAKAWQQRAELKREDPYQFWSAYKPCYICARLRGASSTPRKTGARGNKWRKVLDSGTRLDHNCSWWFADNISDIYSSRFFFYHDSWYWEELEREELREEAFIEKWFSDDYEFEAPRDPWPKWLEGTSRYEYEAALRAWLGCDRDDFWLPFMDEECERIHEERYAQAYEKLPGYVGEKYYDLMPVLPRSKSKRNAARIQIHAQKRSVETFPASPAADWVVLDDTCDDSDRFEVLSEMGRLTDSDWEEV